MKFEIKSRWSSAVLFSIETDSWKLAIEAAVKSGADLYSADLSSADLYSANLSGADLSRADLYRANLSRADLYSANLSRADLYSADLSRADLSRADLSRANLSRANLSRANLSRADLSRADLSRADLSRADLSRADLSRADLSGANGVAAYRCTPLKMLEFQTGTIRLFKLVTADGSGPFNGGSYKVGGEYSEPDADCDEQKQCAPGLNVATLDWCLSHHCEGYRIFLVEFDVKDIAAIPRATGGKIRVKRLKVIEELDLSKYLPTKDEKKGEVAA